MNTSEISKYCFLSHTDPPVHYHIYHVSTSSIATVLITCENINFIHKKHNIRICQQITKYQNMNTCHGPTHITSYPYCYFINTNRCNFSKSDNFSCTLTHDTGHTSKNTDPKHHKHDTYPIWEFSRIRTPYISPSCNMFLTMMKQQCITFKTP